MSGAFRGCVLALVLAACGDEPCFQDILHDHRAELVACEPADECIIPAEDAACACFGAYNARQQELWDSLRSESRCEDCPHGFCPDQVNPRCEDGQCVTDNAGPIAPTRRWPIIAGSTRKICRLSRSTSE